MLKDLYDECDLDFLEDVFETVSAVAIQWNRALTTMSRSFLRQLSNRENVTTRFHAVTTEPTAIASAGGEG